MLSLLTARGALETLCAEEVEGKHFFLLHGTLAIEFTFSQEESRKHLFFSIQKSF